VTLTMMQYGTVPEGESKLQVLKLFEERHPGLKANLDYAPLGYNDKVPTVMAAGTPPDVFWFNPALFLEYTRRGFLLDLTPLLRRDRYDTADFPGKAMGQYHRQSKQWGRPKDFPARGMFFNVAAFDQAGVGHPPATFADPGWTWDRFLDDAQRLTRERGGVSQFGWTMGTAFREWMVWVYGNGGEFVRQDAAECVLHESPAVDALQFLQTCARSTASCPPRRTRSRGPRSP
jgi:multiple sugar transport system substrate-binding protein